MVHKYNYVDPVTGVHTNGIESEWDHMKVIHFFSFQKMIYLRTHFQFLILTFLGQAEAHVRTEKGEHRLVHPGTPLEASIFLQIFT